MKLNTGDYDCLEVSPHLVSGRVGLEIPALKAWNLNEDIIDVGIKSVRVAPSSDGEHAYVVVESVIYPRGDDDEFDVWCCTCPDWRYRKGDVELPHDAKPCKHVLSVSKVEKAMADDDQATLPGGE